MSVIRPIAIVERFAADNDAPRAARRAGDEMINQLGHGGDRAEDLALVISELVTNAVVHGPTGDLQLTLTGTPAMIRVEVGDDGTAAFDWPTNGHDGRNGHWGLEFVSIYSERSGVLRQPETVVWCELDLDGYRAR